MAGSFQGSGFSFKFAGRGGSTDRQPALRLADQWQQAGPLDFAALLCLPPDPTILAANRYLLPPGLPLNDQSDFATPAPAPAPARPPNLLPCTRPDIPNHADVQSTGDVRKIAIDRVGVKNITYPIRLHGPATGGSQNTVAQVNMYVGLPHYKKGST